MVAACNKCRAAPCDAWHSQARARQVALNGLFAKELAAASSSKHLHCACRTSCTFHAPCALLGQPALPAGAAGRHCALRRQPQTPQDADCAGALQPGRVLLGRVQRGAAPAAAPRGSDRRRRPRRGGATTATAGQQPPRLRQFFPETLYWMPELETDDQGRVQVDVPIADSITTWRVSVLASDRDGNLGSAEMGLRVFQDFFVEPDLPRFLTVGDEVDVPITIFNYLDQPQTVTLDVAPAELVRDRGRAAVDLRHRRA